MAKNSTFVATLKFIDSFSGGFSKAMSNINKETKNLQRQMRALNNLGSSVSDLGKRMTVGLTLPIVALGTKATQSAMAFESSMNKIMTLKRKFASNGEIDLNDEESIRKFSENAKASIIDLSNTYGVATTEIGNSYYLLASAFNNTTKMQEAMTNAMQMAVGGGVEASASANALAAVYNAYEKTGVSVTAISDKLIALNNFGFFRNGLADVADTIGTVAPYAAEAEVSLDDLATALAVITSTGVSASEATTYLQNAMQMITKRGDRNEIKDGGFLEYLQKIEETMPEIEDQLKVFTNIRAQKGITALVGNTSLYEEYSKQIKNATGTLQETYEEMSKTSAFQFQLSMQKLNNIMTKFGEKILPTVNKYLEKFTSWLDNINITDKDIENWIAWGKAIALIGPSLVIVGKSMQLVANAGQAAVTIKALAKAFEGLATGGAAKGISMLQGVAPVVAGIASVGLAGVAVGSMVKDTIENPELFTRGGGTTNDGNNRRNATGTNDFQGGWTQINENGPEMVKLPNGSKIIPSNQAKGMGGLTVNIPKLADSIVVRCEEDIDRITEMLAEKLRKVYVNS